MDNSEQWQSDVTRYAMLIEHALAAPRDLAPAAEASGAIQVERGAVLARAVLNAPVAEDQPFVEKLVAVADLQQLSEIAVVDREEHHRPVYRPLLTYAWLTTYRLRYETIAIGQFGRWEEALRVWCDVLESELGEIEWPAEGAAPPRGASIAEATWTALALHVAGTIFVRDAWTDLAADAFGRLVRAQQPAGSFLLRSATDHPERVGFDELVILHAAASYAVLTENRTVASAVARASMYIQDNVEPAHVTNQPWALFAFIWNPQTHPLADQILHHATLPREQGPDPVSLILLADGLYCLRLFLR